MVAGKGTSDMNRFITVPAKQGSVLDAEDESCFLLAKILKEKEERMWSITYSTCWCSWNVGKEKHTTRFFHLSRKLSESEVHKMHIYLDIRRHFSWIAHEDIISLGHCILCDFVIYMSLELNELKSYVDWLLEPPNLRENGFHQLSFWFKFKQRIVFL